MAWDTTRARTVFAVQRRARGNEYNPVSIRPCSCVSTSQQPVSPSPEMLILLLLLLLLVTDRRQEPEVRAVG